MPKLKMNFHGVLIRYRNALGYPESKDGLCALYAQMAINAFLVGELDIFFDRCLRIQTTDLKSPLFALSKKFNQNAALASEAYSEEEQRLLPELLDMLAFFDSGELYAKPHEYAHLFSRPILQAHTEEISHVVQPIALEALGGAISVDSFVGVYSLPALTNYVASLTQFARDANQNFAIRLFSDSHAVALIYSPVSQTWQLIDANNTQFKPVSILKADCSSILAYDILWALMFKLNLPGVICPRSQPVAAFHTDILIKRSQEPSFQPHIARFIHNHPYDRAYHPHVISSNGATLAHLAVVCSNQKGLAGLIAAVNRDGTLRINLDKADKNGTAPIHLVGMSRTTDILALLIEARNANGTFRVDLDRVDNDGRTAVHYAALASNVAILALLIEARNANGTFRVDLDRVNNDGRTPVYYAARASDVATLALLIEARNANGTFRVDLDRVDNDGRTAVHYAALASNVATLALLIEARNANGTFRVDLDRMDNDGSRPILYASCFNGSSIDSLALFVAAQYEDGTFRVDLNQTSNNGITAIHLCTLTHKVDEVALLIAAQNPDGTFRVDLNKRDLEGTSAVATAVQENHVDILIQLIAAQHTDGSFRVDLNQTCNNGFTPLHEAVYSNRIDALNLLLEARAADGSARIDLNKRTYKGKTALFLAAEEGHKDAIEILLRHGADMDLSLVSSAKDLKALVKEKGNKGITKRMDLFLQAQPELFNVRISPKQMALIIGDNEICRLFKEESVRRRRAQGFHGSIFGAGCEEPDRADEEEHIEAPARDRCVLL